MVATLRRANEALVMMTREQFAAFVRDFAKHLESRTFPEQG